MNLFSLPKFRTIDTVGHVLFSVSVILLAVAFLYLRINYINTTFGRIVDCTNCFTKNIVVFDFPVLGLIVASLFLSIYVKPALLKFALKALSLLVLLLYMSDYIVSQNMYTRLQFSDFSTYGQQLSLIGDYLVKVNFISKYSTALVVAVIVLALGLVINLSRSGGRVFLALAISAVGVTLAVSGLIKPTTYVHNWAMVNVFQANFQKGESIGYSEAFEKSLPPYDVNPLCPQEGAQRGDIILLVLESWSAYQGELWGGQVNWTPKLGAIAKENLWFSNMHAAGFTTNEGLSSILTGLDFYSPIETFFGAPAYYGLWNLSNTIPNILKNKGYYTAFLTTGDLSFASKGPWMNDIGFDYVEGHDAPFYDGLPRLHFRSAADEHLYARVLQYYNEKRSEERPLFITIENVSSHQPFIHPHTRKRDIEAVFHYMDDAAADFYQQLSQDGFFADGGLLIVTSDHRSMTPVSRFEHKQFGPSAVSRIPTFIAYKGVSPQEVTTLTHQSDILSTLAQYTSAQSCRLNHRIDLLATPKTQDRCVFHARGDNRDYIDVICSTGNGQILLQGDDSKFVNTNQLSERQQERLLTRAHQVRIKLKKQEALRK